MRDERKSNKCNAACVLINKKNNDNLEKKALFRRRKEERRARVEGEKDLNFIRKNFSH
jgi:hypothetical protein